MGFCGYFYQLNYSSFLRSYDSKSFLISDLSRLFRSRVSLKYFIRFLLVIVSWVADSLSFMTSNIRVKSYAANADILPFLKDYFIKKIGSFAFFFLFSRNSLSKFCIIFLFWL